MPRRRTKKPDILPLVFFVIALIIFVKLLSNQHAISDVISIVFAAILLFSLVFLFMLYSKKRKMAEIKATLLAAGTDNPMQLSPEKYERFCSILLEHNGWNVSLTKNSGDFGADIIANKNGHKMVVQCKQ